MFSFVTGGSKSSSGEAPYAGENRIATIADELATAARHVAEARRIVARRRARFVRLKALGTATLDQELTLRAFVSSLAILESGTQTFADTAKRFKRPQRKLS